LGLAATPAASAADEVGEIAGTPLTVYVGGQGQLQAVREGAGGGIFFPNTSTTGDAGFFLALPSGVTGDPTPRVFGFTSFAGPTGIDEYDFNSASSTSGNGTASDPYVQLTSYLAKIAGGTILYVAQTTTYVNGAQQFGVRWDVKNMSGSAVNFKALVAADFYFDGSDRGTGIFTNGPPRFVGGTNSDTGNSGGFTEVTAPELAPWSAYQALEYGPDGDQIWGEIEGAASTVLPTFDGTVAGGSIDNAGGVEWDQDATGAGLAVGSSRSFELVIKNAVPALLQLTPSNGGAPQGVPIQVTATAVNTDGVPYAGRTLRFQITGANPSSGSVALDPNGQGTIADPGTNAGADTVVAFIDFNNDGTRQPAEPQASALEAFVDNVAPSCKVKVGGDRAGPGGAGKPLKITVSCDEAAQVRAAVTLHAPPAAGSANASMERKKAPVRIRLKPVSITVQPGKALSVKVLVPPKIRRKYAGKTLKEIVEVTARDSSGNDKTVRAAKKLKLAPAAK
jgi:hypothetical protein